MPSDYLVAISVQLLWKAESDTCLTEAVACWAVAFGHYRPFTTSRSKGAGLQFSIGVDLDGSPKLASRLVATKAVITASKACGPSLSTANAAAMGPVA